jgi:uncharacterized coiled-coil DUF342 family protein
MSDENTRDLKQFIAQQIQTLDQKINQVVQRLGQAEQKINQLDQKLDTKINKLDQKLDIKLGQLDQKLDDLSAAVADALYTQSEVVDGQLQGHERRLHRLEHMHFSSAKQP